MNYFLNSCIGLMAVAGIYGATDMTRDIKNGELIDYEHVRERHAKNLLFVIKTTGLGTYKFRSYNDVEKSDAKEMKEKLMKQEEPKEKKVLEYFEEYSRGCEDC